MKNYLSKSMLIAFFVVTSLLLISCAKSEPTSTTNHNAAAPTSTAPPAASPAATTTTTASVETGVPECDAFLKAYEACVKDKVPAAVRPTFKKTLATWKTTWKEQSANPQTKAALVTACKTAQKNSADAMKAYGCTF